jgi:PAS domain S-box-containing protein
MNAPLPAHLLAPEAREHAAEMAGATTALATMPAAGTVPWHLVWDTSPAGQLLLDGAGHITHLNRCAAHGLGWNDERLAAHRACGEPVALASALTLHGGQGLPLPADDLPGLKALRTGLPEAERVLALRLGATQRWLSFSATRLSDAGGVHGVLLNVNDVTQRLQTERERVTEWEHTLEIIKGSRLGLWHSSPWEQRLLLDAQASQLLGLSPQLTPEQALHRWGKAIHPEDNERVWSTIKQHLKGGLISSVTEARVLLPNGQWRWLRTRTHTLQGTGGTENVKLAGTVEDVTEIKGIEAEAQHGHDLLHTLFTHAPMGIQLLDLGSGRTVMCNQALADICGTSIEHILSRSPDQRSSPQTSARRVQWRHDLLGNGSTGPHEFSIRRPDNSWRDVRMSAVRVFDPKGRAFAWAVVQDITATKAYEAQLMAAATRDRLTSMPNRAAMLAHMQELLALARANLGPCGGRRAAVRDRRPAARPDPGRARRHGRAVRWRRVCADPSGCQRPR